VESCNSSACSWHYSTDTKQGEGKCANTNSYKLPILSLSTEIRMFVKHKGQEEEEESQPTRAILKQRSSIEFWCELNNCNNQKIGELVRDAVNEHYDLWKMHLMPVNRIKNELLDEENETPTIDSISNQINIVNHSIAINTITTKVSNSSSTATIKMIRSTAASILKAIFMSKRRGA
jgi:hypothetical protein